MRTITTLETISDGKLYDLDDKVAIDTQGCEGCSACCYDVGDLVVLTPLDVYHMCNTLNQSFDELIKEKLCLRETEGILLPYLGMDEVSKGCLFLDEKKRCSIHSCRPDICRLFPLGRVYEKDDYKYFLQVGNCPKASLKEVEIRAWLGIDDEKAYKAFILHWHHLIKALRFRMKFIRDTEEKRQMQQYVLDIFYRKPKDVENFYNYFIHVVTDAKNHLGIL